MKKGRQMTKRIAVSPEVHKMLTEFVTGLGRVTYDEAIRLLLQQVAGDESLKKTGDRLRGLVDSDFDEEETEE